MAVDKYKGVIKYDSPKTITVTIKEKESMIFLFRNKNDNNRSLSSFKFVLDFSITIFSGTKIGLITSIKTVFKRNYLIRLEEKYSFFIDFRSIRDIEKVKNKPKNNCAGINKSLPFKR